MDKDDWSQQVSAYITPSTTSTGRVQTLQSYHPRPTNTLPLLTLHKLPQVPVLPFMKDCQSTLHRKHKQLGQKLKKRLEYTLSMRL